MTPRTLKAGTLLAAFAILLALPHAAQGMPQAPAAGKAAHAKRTPRLKAASLYECPVCHHKVNAAKAKSLHFTCPVDSGRLAPVKTVSPHK